MCLRTPIDLGLEHPETTCLDAERNALLNLLFSALLHAPRPTTCRVRLAGQQSHDGLLYIGLLEFVAG